MVIRKVFRCPCKTRGGHSLLVSFLLMEFTFSVGYLFLFKFLRSSVVLVNENRNQNWQAHNHTIPPYIVFKDPRRSRWWFFLHERKERRSNFRLLNENVKKLVISLVELKETKKKNSLIINYLEQNNISM